MFKLFLILGILFFLGGGSVGRGLGVVLRGIGCFILIILLILFFIGASASVGAAVPSAAAKFSWDAGRLVPVHGATVAREGNGAVRLRMPSAEWNCGMRVEPSEEGGVLDLSVGKWLAVDVENLSTNLQMRLTMHIGSSGANADSADHAAANATRKRAVNTGMALDPGEKGTMRLLLPHPDVYAVPDGVMGPLLVDTRRVNAIEFKCQWPFEDEFKWVVDCRLSNLRLEGAPPPPFPQGEVFFPFIDRYGQFIHADWPGKIHSDGELLQSLRSDEAALASTPRPTSWDEYGGWKDGPALAPSDSFRTEKVDGKWWLVTPSGHLFFSTGIDVVRPLNDAAYCLGHIEWYKTPPPSDDRMAFPLWNLERKFGKADFEDDYFDLVLRRLDAWGINTLGNWSESRLCIKSRKPYVMTVLDRTKRVKRHRKLVIYDFAGQDFEENMRSAIRARFAEDPYLRHAARDPMCIGFFFDNELPFQKWISDFGKERSEALLERYFRACSEELAAAAPGKLNLGPRFVGFRQPAVIWHLAAKYCDVISVNAYANSVANLPKAADCGKPLLLGEFHFGCMDRGMFRAGLCPVSDQEERGRSYTRLVQGALRNPLFIGCHWFQYRDQPLAGRGDGEAYQCGFVDVVDRPYDELCSAARAVGEGMYQYRSASPSAR